MPGTLQNPLQTFPHSILRQLYLLGTAVMPILRTRTARCTWLHTLVKIILLVGFPNLDLNLNSLIPEPVLLTITYMKKGQGRERTV